jgi:hypothetical protein
MAAVWIKNWRRLGLNITGLDMIRFMVAIIYKKVKTTSFCRKWVFCGRINYRLIDRKRSEQRFCLMHQGLVIVIKYKCGQDVRLIENQLKVCIECGNRETIKLDMVNDLKILVHAVIHQL